MILYVGLFSFFHYPGIIFSVLLYQIVSENGKFSYNKTIILFILTQIHEYKSSSQLSKYAIPTAFKKLIRYSNNH